MKIKRNLLFFVGKESGKIDGKLKLRIGYEDTIIDFNAGYRVEHEKWIKDDQRCKRSTSHGKEKISASEINSRIENFVEWTDSVFKIYEVKDTIPDAEEFRKEFNRLAGKKEKAGKNEFFNKFDEFIKTETEKNLWEYSTIEKFTVLKKHLKNVNPDMSFEYLDEAGLNELYFYLRDTRKMRSSTLKKQFTLLKWFLKWATMKGYNKCAAYSGYKPFVQSMKKTIIFLTWDELMILYNFRIPKSLQPRLEKIKDVFLFACFAGGLRPSDIRKLKKTDINGEVIDVLTQKTKDLVKINLNKYSREILDKYKDIPIENNGVIPTISEQKTNIYLRELCELAGINKPMKVAYYQGAEIIEKTVPKYELISFKSSRKTFVSISLYLGIPENIVTKWTGHSSVEAMKVYMGTDDDQLSLEMSKWDSEKNDAFKKLMQLTPDQINNLLSKL